MRRGIATFRFLAAVAGYAVPVLAGGVLYLAVRLDLASRPATAVPPPAGPCAEVRLNSHGYEIRGLVLAPRTSPAPP